MGLRAGASQQQAGLLSRCAAEPLSCEAWEFPEPAGGGRLLEVAARSVVASIRHAKGAHVMECAYWVTRAARLGYLVASAGVRGP